MAETLLAILLVTTSAKGSSLVYQWPPLPTSSSRFCRPPLDDNAWSSQLDNPWRASRSPQILLHKMQRSSDYSHENDPEYGWWRPSAIRDRSVSFSRTNSHNNSERNTPSKEGAFSNVDDFVFQEYGQVLGYSSKFLASLLCPQRSMCHQKFELVVDDLVFIGHPVCADVDGNWSFKPDRLKIAARGRESRSGKKWESPQTDERGSLSPATSSLDIQQTSESSWLHTFHFVLVLDLPDPSSSASGNVSKYFDIIYEQIAFTITAILYQEQVLSNFVETECDTLGSLKEDCIAKDEPFSTFLSQAIEVSSIALAMKLLYEAIKSSSLANITIHNIPLELQLPPYLDLLLHTETEYDSDFLDHPEDDTTQSWGPDMSSGWRLPTLAPWKSLLLLENLGGTDAYINLKGPQVNLEERNVAEGLIRFLDTASVTLSLADMANLLEWDIESQIYPIVRWLVHHRRAKVVDTVHAGLKTMFTLPAKFDAPIIQLAAEFARNFSHPAIPSLPRILSIISTSMSKQTDNHFFASVVKSKEFIPMYHDVVIWMLKRELLITLHLRIRVVATQELKVRVRLEREKKLARKLVGLDKRGRSMLKQEIEFNVLGGTEASSQIRSGIAWLSLSPKTARKYVGRRASKESGRSDISELVIAEDDEDDYGSENSDLNLESDLDGDSGWETADSDLGPSMVNDPGRATPLQRRWLSAMSDGKEPHIARRFELINQYFDGKRSDDEILYQAEISRKQLREVLHHYEEYLQTFLHPS